MRFELSRVVKAPREKAFTYYTHVEKLPEIHPDFVKRVNVLTKEGNTLIAEQESEAMGKRIRSVNQFTFQPLDKIEVETLDGDGKGSKITWTFQDVPEGTKVTISNDLKLGLLAGLFKPVIQGLAEKTFNEDAMNIEQGRFI